MRKLRQIKQEIGNNAILERLEETGEIKIDFINCDIDLLIQALEDITGKEYTIVDKSGYRAITEYRKDEHNA